MSKFYLPPSCLFLKNFGGSFFLNSKKSDQCQLSSFLSILFSFYMSGVQSLRTTLQESFSQRKDYDHTSPTYRKLGTPFSVYRDLYLTGNSPTNGSSPCFGKRPLSPPAEDIEDSGVHSSMDDGSPLSGKRRKSQPMSRVVCDSVNAEEPLEE